MTSLQPAKRFRPPSEDPSVRIRLGVLFGVALVLFAVVVFRLWFMQVLSGDYYVAAADNNRVRTVSVQAPRGVIKDRNGEVLVENRAGLSVGVLPMDLTDAAAVLPKLAGILGLPLEEIEAKVEKAKKQDPYRVVVLAEDVSETPTVAYLKEHGNEFPGVRIEKSYLRKYPHGSLAAHVLGYVGEISEEELALERFKLLKPGAQVGKQGVEFFYDAYLRGTDGNRQIEVDAQGRPKRLLDAVDPQPGNVLILSLDARLQQAAEAAIREGIKRAHADGFKDADAGAVVAMDPRTGEVLALVSYPDYDPAVWVGGIKQDVYESLIADSANKPLFNRAIGGLYPAASTFKAFVAATALREGLVSWDTVSNCTGTYRVSDQVLRCWNRDGHGEVNLVEAIMESCDVFFYRLGELFYEQTGSLLQEGVRRFGFGQTTGIDLPGESAGRVPDKEWKRKVGQTDQDRIWRPGDEVNLCIGQGDLLVTPLQLAVAYSAIANKGKLLVPRVAKMVTNASGVTVHEFGSEVRAELGLDSPQYAALYKGLELVTQDPNGTAYKAWVGFPIPVAGKTGTAEKLPDDDYAWFVGYAPMDNPQIVVVALVEKGGHGSSVAAPVVRRVMEAFFDTGDTGLGPVEWTD